MKMLTVIYDSAIDRSLMGLLEEMEIPVWTKLFGIHGQGQSGLKVNTPVWPGSNFEIRVAGDEPTLREIASNIRTLQAEFKLQPGIFMTLQEIENL
ncbi:MAG: hypothetical protein M3Y56_09435 [Armatimonadota bacterium]|nr:hypothetical protein [Armatimonadota bacterium]